MKDFTPCEHGSHPMGCIQCQLAVQPPATPQEPEQAQTLNDVFDVFETWARRKGATDTSSVSLGFWAFNEFHAIIGQPLRDWLLSRRASTPSPEGQTWQPIETAPKTLRQMVGMAGEFRQTLLTVRECIDALTPGHRTGYDWNADPLYLTRYVGDALKAIDAGLKSLSSVEPTPEPETCEWRREVGNEYFPLNHDDASCQNIEDLQAFTGCPYCLKPLRLVPSEETPR